jgi:hypothetical protein
MRALRPGTRAKRWSVLREFRDKLQRFEHLKITFRPGGHAIALRLRTSALSH